MMNWNEFRVGGNLTRDVELRYTTSGTPVADIGIAVNGPPKKDKDGNYLKDAHGYFQRDTDYFDVTVWSINAENSANHLKKGDAVFVAGHLRTETWVDKVTKQNRSRLKLVAVSIQFLTDRRGGRPEPEQVEEQEPSPESFGQ